MNTATHWLTWHMGSLQMWLMRLKLHKALAVLASEREQYAAMIRYAKSAIAELDALAMQQGISN